MENNCCDSSNSGDVKSADNIVIETENSGGLIQILTSNYTMRFNTPLQMIWQPKEDITTYELALCIPFFNRDVFNHQIDDSMSYLRHFKITDYNKK